MPASNATPSYANSPAAVAASNAGPHVANEMAAEKLHETAQSQKRHETAESAAAAALAESQRSDEESYQEIGWSFVEQYYTHVNKNTEKLHLFYKKDSTAVHGVETFSVPSYLGQREIVNLIASHKFKDCKVMVSNIDCQKTLGDGILVQVIGEMANEGEPSQKFVQTILLAPQNTGYYVLNDILRFLKEDVGSDYEYASSSAEPPSVEAQVVEPEVVEKEEAVVPAAEPVIAEPVATPEPVAVQAESSLFSQPLEKSKKTETEVAATPVEVTPTSTPAETVVEKVAEKVNGSSEVPSKAATPAPVAAQTPPAASTPTAAPSGPVTPALPATPMSWADRAAVKPAAALVAPAAPAPVTTPAAPAAPAASAPASAPAAPAPAAAVVEKTQQASVVATASGHRRGPKEYFSAYIKHVTEAVNEKQLKQALQQIGTVTHFEIARQKNCAFVDFVDLPTLKAALAVHELKLGNNVSVLIEERKRGGAKKNNVNNNNNNNSNNTNTNTNSNGGSNGYYNARRGPNGSSKKGPRPQQ